MADSSDSGARERASAEQLAERLAYALQLKQLAVPPTVALQRVTVRFGVSTRQARRYLAHAGAEVRQDGVPAERDLLDGALALAVRVLSGALLDAAEEGDRTALCRLSRELRELKVATRAGPELQDDELRTAMRIQAARDAMDDLREREP